MASWNNIVPEYIHGVRETATPYDVIKTGREIITRRVNTPKRASRTTLWPVSLILIINSGPRWTFTRTLIEESLHVSLWDVYRK